MEGTEHVENGVKQKVSTLVFMDLETTGLPSDVGKRNVHITEMSMVAVDRNNFEVDGNLRVLNKISLCVRPRSVISPVCMSLTGLYNDILESQEQFDDSVPKLLEYFFRRLQKPICLLAHNGNRFDFPVLQAELKRLNYSFGSDIVCADTLVAFRSICLFKKQEAKAKEEAVMCYKNIHISEEDMDKMLLDDMESFSQIDAELASLDKDVLESDLTEDFPMQQKSEVVLPGSQEIFCSQENRPLSSEGMLSPSQNEKTPQKKEVSDIKVQRKRKILDPTFLPKNMYKKKALSSAKRNLFSNPVKRNLFPDPEIHKITKFSLPHLYSYFFNESPPNSHFAETDCISLSKVCQRVHTDFLHWVDDNNVAFSMIDALW